jgi:flagellar basal body rod protein FlgG
MDSLTMAAASGIRSRMQSLDLLANNLANAGTSGFKRDQEFYGLFQSAEASPDENGATTSMPNIERQWTDFSPGLVQVTGNPMDVALQGNGFLVVQGKSGPLYTRNGSLKVLPSGELATGDGFALRNTSGGTIKVAAGQPIEITPDGVVSQNNQSLGQFQVVNFKSTNSLTKVSGASFSNSDPKNPAVAASNVQIEQGKLEGSNVPVAEAAMQLVGVMRQFEMLQKAIGVGNEMDTKTIQEVARVGS